jgi:NAD(P)H dehydrogenase (quinone)
METTMAHIKIVFASRTGETAAIANLIAEGVRISGHDATVVEAKSVKKVQELEDCDALVLGSATYHGEMMESMKTLLFLAEKAALQGKVGAAFGAFGWSGEAPERIFNTMLNIYKMKMVSGPLTLKSSRLAGAIQMAQQYGRDVVATLGV